MTCADSLGPYSCCVEKSNADDDDAGWTQKATAVDAIDPVIDGEDSSEMEWYWDTPCRPLPRPVVSAPCDLDVCR